jgi:hypothetical protein
MDEYNQRLLDAVDAAVPRWVTRQVTLVITAWRGEVPAEVAVAAQRAGEQARIEVGQQLRRLLETDIDQQRTNPLSLLRQAVRYPTEVLRAAGVPPVVRPAFEEQAFPDDVYNLSPASWRDVDDSLHEPGLVWGAWKAKQHLARRRAEGKID